MEITSYVVNFRTHSLARQELVEVARSAVLPHIRRIPWMEYAPRDRISAVGGWLALCLPPFSFSTSGCWRNKKTIVSLEDSEKPPRERGLVWSGVISQQSSPSQGAW